MMNPKRKFVEAVNNMEVIEGGSIGTLVRFNWDAKTLGIRLNSWAFGKKEHM